MKQRLLKLLKLHKKIELTFEVTLDLDPSEEVIILEYLDENKVNVSVDILSGDARPIYTEAITIDSLVTFLERRLSNPMLDDLFIEGKVQYNDEADFDGLIRDVYDHILSDVHTSQRTLMSKITGQLANIVTPKLEDYQVKHINDTFLNIDILDRPHFDFNVEVAMKLRRYEAQAISRYGVDKGTDLHSKLVYAVSQVKAPLAADYLNEVALIQSIIKD